MTERDLPIGDSSSTLFNVPLYVMFDSSLDEGIFNDRFPSADFLTEEIRNRVNVLREEKRKLGVGQITSGLQLELAGYFIMLKAIRRELEGSTIYADLDLSRQSIKLGDELYFCWPAIYKSKWIIIREVDKEKRSNDRVLAIVHEPFYNQRKDFLKTHLLAKRTAAKRFEKVVELFRENGGGHLVPAELIEFPTVYVQLDDLEAAANLLDLYEKDLIEGLNSCLYWTFSPHIVWGNNEGSPASQTLKRMQINSDNVTIPPHDAEARVYQAERIEGIRPQEWLENVDFHERIHRVSDPFTKIKFDINSTILNEGLSDYFARDFQALIERLRKRLETSSPKEAIRMPPSIEEMFVLGRSDDWLTKELFYSGGALLIRAIGMAYCSKDNEQAANPDVGVVRFLLDLYGDGERSEKPLNEAILDLLKKRRIIEKVRTTWAEYWGEILG